MAKSSVKSIESISVVAVEPIGLSDLQDEKATCPRIRLQSKVEKTQVDVMKATANGMEDMLKSFGKNGVIDKMDEFGSSALHLAVRHNDVSLMTMLLEAGADIDLQGHDGYTPLHVAARFNSIEATALLLERHADVTISCHNNSIPLHVASRLGFIEIVKLLLKHDNSKDTINTRGTGDVTPLFLASKNGNRVLCEKLIENKADITVVTIENETPLHTAASNGHVEVVKLLIETASKKLIDSKDYIDIPEYEGYTPLHVACFMGQEKVVHELLINGANLHIQSTSLQECVLHVAVRCARNINIIEDLLKHGADIEVQDIDHRTPLHKAASANQDVIVKLLLDKGAKIDSFDTTKLTPFLLAVKNGNTESARVLLEGGANMKDVDMDLKTCFHLAVLCKSLKTLKMLIAKDDGSLIEKTELKIQKPLHYAAAIGDIEILNVLLKHQCRYDVVDEDEMTPLHISAINGAIHATELLAIASPMCLGFKDIYGRTPLHCAAEKGFKKTCAVLLDFHTTISSRDLNRRSPLHTAVEAGALSTVKLLLQKRNSQLLGMLDVDENSALHLACARDEVEIVKTLLDNNADVTVINRDGKTCLDLAIDWQMEGVANVLVQHKRWWEIMSTKGADGYGPMKRLIEVLPDVAKIALNQCVQLSYLPTNHPNYWVEFNVMLLDPGPDDEASLRGESFEGPSTMVQYNREDLLNHPVTQALLRYKWFAYGKLVYYGNFVLFVVLTILFSHFIVTERDKMAMHYPTTPNATSESTRLIKEGQTGSTFTIAGIIAFMICFELSKEIYQMIVLKLEYFKEISNYIELVLFVNALLFIIPYLAGKPLYISSSVQWNSGIVALFLFYVNLLLFIRSVGQGGLYVSMYFEVWYTFLKVLGVFFVIIIGSTLVFYVLLKEEDNFSSVGFAFVKTTVMMVGELDYTDVLSDNVVNKKINPATGLPYVPLPIVTYVVFMFFMAAVPVLLMNLLVGLAVGDIEAIQRSASFSRVKDQVKFVVDAQRRYPIQIRRYLYKDKLKVKPNKNRMLNSFLLAGTSVTDQSYINDLSNLKSKMTKGKDRDDETNQWEKQNSKLRELESKLATQNKLMLAIAEKLGITAREETDTEL